MNAMKAAYLNDEQIVKGALEKRKKQVMRQINRLDMDGEDKVGTLAMEKVGVLLNKKRMRLFTHYHTPQKWLKSHPETNPTKLHAPWAPVDWLSGFRAPVAGVGALERGLSQR
eukprot:s438_g12.t1